jgi:hypothetical protein
MASTPSVPERRHIASNDCPLGLAIKASLVSDRGQPLHSIPTLILLLRNS